MVWFIYHSMHVIRKMQKNAKSTQEKPENGVTKTFSMACFPGLFFPAAHVTDLLPRVVTIRYIFKLWKTIDFIEFSTTIFQQAAVLVPWSAHALGGDLLGREAARRLGQLGRADAAAGLPSRSALPPWCKL